MGVMDHDRCIKVSGLLGSIGSKLTGMSYFIIYCSMALAGVLLRTGLGDFSQGLRNICSRQQMQISKFRYGDLSKK